MYQPPILDLQATVLDPAPRGPRRVRRVVAIAAAAFLLPLGLYFALAPRYRAHRQASVKAVSKRHAVSRKAVNTPAKPLATGRLVYPYSVIPGGAYNVAELARAMDSEPVVARHYGGFDRSKLATTRSLSVRPAYVSYRLGDTIYWTRKPVRLKMGELLLTDGTNFARARCGNRIAWSVQSPVASSEPVPTILDVPVFVADQPAIPAEEVASISPKVRSEPGPATVRRAGRHGWLVPVVGAGLVAGVVAAATHGKSRRGGGKSGGGGGNSPPVVVPEPSFLVPCLAGLAAIVARQAYRSRGPSTTLPRHPASETPPPAVEP